MTATSRPQSHAISDNVVILGAPLALGPPYLMEISKLMSNAMAAWCFTEWNPNLVGSYA